MSNILFAEITKNIANANFAAEEAQVNLSSNNFYDSDFLIPHAKTNDPRVIEALQVKLDTSLVLRTDKVEVKLVVCADVLFDCSAFEQRGAFLSGNPFNKDKASNLSKFSFSSGEYFGDYTTTITFLDEEFQKQFMLEVEDAYPETNSYLVDNSMLLSNIFNDSLESNLREHASEELNKIITGERELVSAKNRIKYDILKLTQTAVMETKQAFNKLLG